ncbi:MAG: PQQ-dependent sugar dehydrogenase [Gammaproteobacteria bacterium]
MSPRRIRAATRLLLATLLAGGSALAADLIDSEEHAFRVTIVARDLAHPWGMAFLPDGRMLVTERGGSLRLVGQDGSVSAPLAGVPRSDEVGQGGLLDVTLHPGFEDNRLVYLSLAVRGEGGAGTEVVRARFDGDALADAQTIFRALPKFAGGRHFGSRLLFLPDGTLLVTLGDRGHRPNGQNLGTHPGSIIRINDDGSVPADNPLVGLDGVRPEIYTYGNRNVQGITIEPGSGTVWAHEHGPQGGCEVNEIVAGSNYGWATITYGRNYGTGTRIGDGETREGVRPPALQWTPSIAPSGLAYYDGDSFPAWRGNLFAGSLKFDMVSRLVLEGGRIVHEERLLEGALGRIRDVRQGPDGYLYLLTDSRRGVLARLEPAR